MPPSYEALPLVSPNPLLASPRVQSAPPGQAAHLLDEESGGAEDAADAEDIETGGEQPCKTWLMRGVLLLVVAALAALCVVAAPLVSELLTRHLSALQTASSTSSTSLTEVPMSDSAPSSSSFPYSARLNLYFMDGAEEEPARLFPLPDTGRYIRPRVAGQFNNQRQGLSIAALFALTLGRTLILPSKSRVYEVLDVPSLARFVPVITEEAYLRKLAALHKEADAVTSDPHHPVKRRLNEYDMRWQELKDLYYLSREGFEADPAQQEYVKKHGSNRVVRFVLDEWDVDPNVHNMLTFNNGPPWNFWRQDIAFPKNIMDDFERGFGRHMHFRLDLWQRAGVALDWLASLRGGSATSDAVNTFHAIHWRQTDHPEFLQISPELARSSVAAWGLMSGTGGVLYIATDDPRGGRTRSFVSELRAANVTVVLYDDSPLAALASVDPESDSYRPFIEQILLAHADQFLPSSQSTYSGFVIRMRQWMKNPNARNETREFYAGRGYDTNPEVGVRPHTKVAPNFDLFRNTDKNATERIRDSYTSARPLNSTESR